MHWIVEEKINSNSNLIKLKNELIKSGHNFIEVNVEYGSPRVISEGIPLSTEESTSILNSLSTEDCFLYGSKFFVNTLKIFNFNYGDLSNDNFDIDSINKILGDDSFNIDATVDYLSNLEPSTSTVFVRPNSNTKLMDGSLMSKEEFIEFKQKNMNQNRFLEEKIVIASQKPIKAEYRFFIFNDEIVASSSYRSEGGFNTLLMVSKEIVDYVKIIIAKNPLAIGYCIDIAETNNGFKVLEYNNINTSGFYNHNVSQFVEGIAKNIKELK